VQFCDSSLELICTSKFVKDLPDFSIISLSHLASIAELRSLVVLVILRLQDDSDPSLDVVILCSVKLNYPICIPYSFFLNLNQFIYHSLDDANAHLIVLRFSIMVNHNKVLMDHKQDSLHIKR
jgi:hypothetical protein